VGRVATVGARQDYVHGYSGRERERLTDQADTLAELLHSDTLYPSGSVVLEVGCGVGAQTVTLARRSPEDVRRDGYLRRFPGRCPGAHSIRRIQERGVSAGRRRASCLEHLSRPREALAHLGRVLKPGGTITVIEGDHGSAYYHPDSRHAIRCLIELQARAGGASLIGRTLYPLLVNAGFRHVTVSPRMVYVDSSRPQLVEGFTKNTFTAMVEGVRERTLAAGLIDDETWAKGIRDLYRTAEADGTFCYTFFKAVATT